MHLDVIPRKTDLACHVLRHAGAIPRAQRQFLHLIDGHKSLRDLSESATQLGIDNVALASLANAGLIHWSRDEAVPITQATTATIDRRICLSGCVARDSAIAPDRRCNRFIDGFPQVLPF